MTDGRPILRVTRDGTDATGAEFDANVRLETPFSRIADVFGPGVDALEKAYVDSRPFEATPEGLREAEAFLALCGIRVRLRVPEDRRKRPSRSGRTSARRSGGVRTVAGSCPPPGSSSSSSSSFSSGSGPALGRPVESVGPFGRGPHGAREAGRSDRAKARSPRGMSANARLEDAITTLESWLPNEAREYAELLARLLAALPGGEELEELGYEATPYFGWQEAEMLGDLLQAIGDAADVAEAARRLFSPRHGDALHGRDEDGCRECAGAPPAGLGPTDTTPVA